MKSITLIILVSVSLTSCKKTYTCHCSELSTSYPYEAMATGNYLDYTVKAYTKKKAGRDCSKHETKDEANALSWSCNIK